MRRATESRRPRRRTCRRAVLFLSLAPIDGGRIHEASEGNDDSGNGCQQLRTLSTRRGLSSIGLPIISMQRRGTRWALRRANSISRFRLERMTGARGGLDVAVLASITDEYDSINPARAEGLGDEVLPGTRMVRAASRHSDSCGARASDMTWPITVKCRLETPHTSLRWIVLRKRAAHAGRCDDDSVSIGGNRSRHA